LAMQLLSGPHRGVDPFQPFGDLFLDLPEHKAATNYRRELDLSAAIARVAYDVGGIRHTREVFAAATEPLIIVTLSAEKPGQWTGVARLARVPDSEGTLLYESPRRDGPLEFGFLGRFDE